MLYSVWYILGGRRHYKGPTGNAPPSGPIHENSTTPEPSTDDEKGLSV